MKIRNVTTIAAAAGALALVLAPAATAAMPGSGSSASDTVAWLRDQGHHVQINGSPNGSLSQCVATGVHGLRDSNIDDHGRRLDASAFTTVYVDVSCNNTA